MSATFAQQQVHPCHGRNVGFARDIQSCAHFWRCGENPPSRGICPNQNTFDGELERCVLPRNSRCFQCGNRVPYELRSVPRICQQFTRCTSGTATLHACPNGLFFDGRNGIRNCNWRPAGGGCHRENENDGDNTGLCPSVVGHRVLYFRARGSCSRWAQDDLSVCVWTVSFMISHFQVLYLSTSQYSTNSRPMSIWFAL